MDELNFDRAIEILEITDISKIKLADLPSIAKKAMGRWHPDRIVHAKDEDEIRKYTENFQLIEPSIELVRSFLSGELHAGARSSGGKQRTYEEPAEVIRRHAEEIREQIRAAWADVKRTKYKWKEEVVVLSDGFSLRDLLRDDFKEDLAGLSVISLAYGIVGFIIPVFVGALIAPPLGVLLIVIWGVQALACILGFLPLSRFWLPTSIQPHMLKLIDIGLGVYNWANRESYGSSGWLQFLVQIPVLLSSAIKYIILFPLYEIAKLIVGDKRVGVVKKKVNYYAGMADWYVDQLLQMDPQKMNEEQLFDLSYLAKEFKDLREGL